MPPTDPVPAELWTQQDAARGYTELTRRCEALFVALGRLAPQLESDAATVAAATLARRLGRHSAAWAALVPESVLLEDARASAQEAAPVGDSIDEALAAVDALRADLQQFRTRSSDVADADARALARVVLGDIDTSWAGMRPSPTGSAGR